MKGSVMSSGRKRRHSPSGARIAITVSSTSGHGSSSTHHRQHLTERFRRVLDPGVAEFHRSGRRVINDDVRGNAQLIERHLRTHGYGLARLPSSYRVDLLENPGAFTAGRVGRLVGRLTLEHPRDTCSVARVLSH